MRRLSLLVVLVVAAGPVRAQKNALKAAAETITAADVARHLGVIADDSMRGRRTPSRGLQLTAQYVADQFKQFGLKPGGDKGTWWQRYPVPNDTTTAPNTVGMLEGSDPKLKHEYIVFVAHMDHLGIKRGEMPDSIFNGADDNASGTVGVIELAQAFSHPGARPKRSIIFLTVSGEERGHWGSLHFVDHPPVPFEQIVAAINLDMIGYRLPVDSFGVAGTMSSDLGIIVYRANAAHPELRITLPDSTDLSSEDIFGGGSDHQSFVDKGIPSLFFHDGSTIFVDYHWVTDSPDKIDPDKEARVLRLAFYVAQEAANANPRPQWYESVRRRFKQ